MASLRNVFMIIMLAWSCLFPAIAQQVPRYTTNGESFQVGYLEYLPPDYATGMSDFPVLIFLHGGNEGGDGSPSALERVKSWGPPSLIDGGEDMCFTVNGENTCFIVLSPQKPDNTQWPFVVEHLIQHMINTYRVDMNRIYLTGLSRGGLGVYQYASSDFNKPNKLAAIAPMSAWSDVNGCTISKRKISVWAFHGQRDTVVPYWSGLSAFNSILSCSDPPPDAEMIFTTYSDRYHDSWIPGYHPYNEYHSPNLYEWLLLQKRREMPPDPVTSIEDGHEVRPSCSIYPNPARDMITFEPGDNDLNEVSIRIMTVTGSLIRKVDDLSGSIDVSDLPSAFYLLQIENRSGIIATQRLMMIK